MHYEVLFTQSQDTQRLEKRWTNSTIRYKNSSYIAPIMTNSHEIKVGEYGVIDKNQRENTIQILIFYYVHWFRHAFHNFLVRVSQCLRSFSFSCAFHLLKSIS